MSIRGADIRFLLPRAPRSVVLSGAAQRLAQGFREAGVMVLPHLGEEPVDAVLADGSSLRPRDIARAGSVVVFGRRLPPGLPPDWSVRRYLQRGELAAPKLLALTDKSVRGYLARKWLPPVTVKDKLRGHAFASPVGALTATLTVAGPGPLVPYPIAAARDCVPQPAPAGWFLHLGHGDDLQRVIAQVFNPDFGVPSWVVKYSRIAGAPRRGDTEIEVLTLLSQLAPALSDQAVGVLGEFSLNGSQATVERAAPGSTLALLLEAGNNSAARSICEDLLGWAVELGAATARPATGQTHAELSAMLEHYGAQSLMARLTDVPECVAHNDLGTWNVQSDGHSFTVLDWENATKRGWPIGDVAYLITDMLAVLHGPANLTDRPAWCCRLWRGELPHSPTAWRWVARAAAAVGVGPDTTAALVTSCWLFHGLTLSRRSSYLTGAPVAEGYLGRMAEIWLADPVLGLDWRGGAP